jgi:hypothetical protein
MRNELLAIAHALKDIVRIGDGTNLNLDPSIPEPIDLAVLRQALLQLVDDAARHGHVAAGAR